MPPYSLNNFRSFIEHQKIKKKRSRKKQNNHTVTLIRIHESGAVTISTHKLQTLKHHTKYQGSWNV